ncbi:MAG: response regulator transcription factor [Actinobacteria bacterium]|nr:MAG: response regulator transcription factor [Actinomycetota bacterium]
MDSVKVFVMGRKAACVEGLAAMLHAAEGVEVVGRAAEWDSGLTRSRALAADVVVVDMVHCPDCGPAMTADVVRALEGARVVVAGVTGGDVTAIDALEAGALGFINLDHLEPEAVTSAVKAVASGEAVLDSSVSTALLTRMRRLSMRAAAAGPTESSPTIREAEILELLAKGMSNAQMARTLHVSESTVKNHLHAIYSKLGVDSRAQAVSEAIRRGLVTL